MKRFLFKLSDTQNSEPMSPKSVEQFASAIKRSQFTEEEIIKLYDDFKEVSNRLFSVDKRQFPQLLEKIGMTKVICSLAHQTYKTDMGDITINLSESAVLRDITKTLFNLYDANGDKRIDFGEFLIGTHILTTRNITKMSSGIFHLYDYNKDGVISREDLFTTLQNSMESAKKVFNNSIKKLKDDIVKEKLQIITKQMEDIHNEKGILLMVEEIFKFADIKKRGYITQTEFINYVEDHKEILRLFLQISAGMRNQM